MITIRQIAAEAGVSTATVSRVFGNHPNVKEEIRKRVMLAARKYDYYPRLSMRKRNVILLTPSRSQYPAQNYVEMVMNALARELAERNFRIEILPADNLNQLKHLQFCATVLIGSDVIGPEEWNRQFDAPLIVFDRHLPKRYEGVHSVRSDEQQGMTLAVEYLMNKGHRRIGCLIARNSMGNPELRSQILKQIVPDPGLVRLVEADNYLEDTGKLIKAGVDAVFSPGGNGGIMTAYALFLYGKKIPDDISLVVSERSMISRYCIPSQTAITQEYEALATAVVDVVEAKIGNRVVEHEIIYPYRLIERDSVADRS